MVDAACADLERERAATGAAVAGHVDLGERAGRERVAIPVLTVHRIDAYARHCGHADLPRECADGRMGR
ncbi:protein of unknown function DUF664 [Actinobacteria bacterium OV450]|nr:protein of unknown function DUF664 [Actinobacteria bacterium OV450]